MSTGINYRLPAEHRVKQRRDFLSINKHGQLSRCPNFLVFMLESSDAPTRIGVTVTRKIGGAVVRNRIKRYLREFFRVDYQSLPKSTDISFIAKRGAEKLSFHELQSELRTLFSSIKGQLVENDHKTRY